jgi:hypothetical protein
MIKKTPIEQANTEIDIWKLHIDYVKKFLSEVKKIIPEAIPDNDVHPLQSLNQYLSTNITNLTFKNAIIIPVLYSTLAAWNIHLKSQNPDNPVTISIYLDLISALGYDKPYFEVYDFVDDPVRFFLHETKEISEYIENKLK